MDEVRAPASHAGTNAGVAASRAGVPDTTRRAPHPYSDVIRRRWRRPAYRGDLPGATAVAEDVNPLCGDRVRMMVAVRDGRVAEVRFAGDSCAICTASADIVAELVTGRPMEEARALGRDAVLEMLDTEIRMTRMQCVALPVAVLRQALGTR